MSPNWCLQGFRPLSTRVLHALELHDLNPADSSWAAFTHYIRTCTYVPTYVCVIFEHVRMYVQCILNCMDAECVCLCMYTTYVPMCVWFMSGVCACAHVCHLISPKMLPGPNSASTSLSSAPPTTATNPSWTMYISLPISPCK